MQDYDLNIQSLDDQRKVVYNYNFNDNLNLAGKNINIDLFNAPLTNLTGNPLNSHRWSFASDPKTSLFNNTSIASPLIGTAIAGVIAAPIIAAAVAPAVLPATQPFDRENYSPWGRKEYRNKKIEHSFYVWAVFATLFFMIAMLAGLIGVCCCHCPHLSGRNTDWWDFFYQKVL